MAGGGMLNMYAYGWKGRPWIYACTYTYTYKHT